MAKLTEEMVIARTRQSDLSTIKKLNCWGSDLTDVSIIRRMRGVQVLALSVNHISTLADFESCEQLIELYLRKNKIEDLSELAYLQSLPHLRNLWLEENPCVERAGKNYRLIVLRALPNLKVLDNVEVTPEEVNDAMRASVRREETPVYEEQYQEPVPQRQQQQEYRQPSPVREKSPPIHDKAFHMANERDFINSPLRRLNRQSMPVFDELITRSPASDQDVYYSSAAASTTSNNNTNNRESLARERGTMASSISTQSMKEYYQSDYQQQRTPNGGNGQYRHSQTDLSEWEEHENMNGAGGRGRRSMAQNDRDVPASYGRQSMGHPPVSRDDWEEEKVDVRRRMSSAHVEHRRSESRFNDSTVVPNSVLNHYASLQRRPTHRNANLLSATLCLIKELDLSSLEVVEHAVRCRIDELHAHAE